MAIIDCRECGREISDKALKCTHCGFQLRKPQRGVFGWMLKWTFILFNILMLVSVFAGLSGMGDLPPAESEAEEAGRSVGAFLGVSALLGFWAAGSLILGLLVLLTRPKS